MIGRVARLPIVLMSRLQQSSGPQAAAEQKNPCPPAVTDIEQAVFAATAG